MAHDHVGSETHSKNVVLAFAITVVFMVVEASVGFFTGSLVLVADAGHMLTDAAGLPTSLAPDTDAENAIRISERRAWTIDQLKAELQRGNDEVLGWLSQLRDDHRELRPEGLGMTLGKFFRIVQEEHHDLIHLEQLRTSPNT
jgi:hypothetical protein